jgi:nuclear polyadenylated RNA-binding protein NAB2
LPTSFHRGLGSDAPNVSLMTPQPGSIGAPSPHRSVTFNKEKEELQRKVKELEEKKAEAQKKVNEAEAAAAAKKEDGAKSVAIAV